MSRSLGLKALLASSTVLIPSEAIAEVALRTGEHGLNLVGTAAIAGGVFAFCVAFGLAAVPAINRAVLPPPPETYLSDLLQFGRILEDGVTIECKDGTLVQTIAFAGMDYGSKAPDEREAAFVRRKTWFDSLSETPAVTVKIISTRERVSADLEAEYDNETLQQIHDAWMAEFEQVYSNSHYIVFSVPSSLKGALRVLNEAVKDAQDQLHEYGPKRLDSDHGSYSPLLTFWAGQVNGFRHVASAHTQRLSERLPACAVNFHPDTGIIEYQDGGRRLYQAAVSIKAWGEAAEPGLMGRLLAIDGQLTVLQCVEGISRTAATTTLRHRARQAILLFQNSFVREEFNAAIELVEGNRETLVNHCMTVFLLADNLEEVERLIGEVRRVFAEFGVKPAIETAAAEWLWRCRLPGFDKMVRQTALLGSNLAYLVTFEDEPAGIERSDWGPGPLRLFKTVGGSAYALQVHVSDEPEALAHTVAIAKTGTGKTTFFQHLIGGALRHPDLRAYIFDRFSGTRIFTTACGGSYLDMATKSVQLNPLQCDDTEQNRSFLHVWLRKIAGVEDGDGDSYEAATRAVEAIFGVRRSERSLSAIFDSAFDNGTALKKGLTRWVEGGNLAGWFNGTRDSLALASSRLVGFEMSDVFSDKGAGGAMVSYIMHRIRAEVRAAALPHFVLFEETAPLIQDGFAKDIAVFLREHRKLRGSVNLVFQDATAIMNSGIGDTILNQCQTQFLFPNDAARREDYALFDLTDSQWEYIKGTSRLARSLRHSCLVKRGNESVILDLDLRCLGPLLKVYKSGSEPVRLMAELQQKWGTDKWLPHYINLA
jgi:type IV secretion/conjugal transfer VirB4 family ATPase